MKIFIILISIIIICYILKNFYLFSENIISVNAIIASTSKEIEQGLMFRKKPLSKNEKSKL